MNPDQRSQRNILGKGRSSDFIVRLKNEQGMAISGKIEHIQTGQVQFFDDFLEMLMLIQDKLDEKGYPQCDTELRTFSST